MAKVYLALYKHQRSWLKEPIKFIADRITRFFTKGTYSHCEIAVERGSNGYDCYSSSVQDGGVRCKRIDVSDASKWDLLSLDDVSEDQIKAYFNRTCGAKYDWWGALGIVLGVKQKRSKYFCSEWCFNAIHGGESGWYFTPNQLSVIFTKVSNH
ncbi:enoyl-CoA hydratase [uncultured Aggregatibacter sp.]|uniref:enoyl-CoA hydratase n=1 Tax=uncultured Aggregatibacter sp. TaxID=470564 RepID=UPI001A5C8BBB|nr:enoyl-CoA hydratase [uncultured Aggregatibacter sp.]VTX83770.1 Uncharacterised protein [uncultured Aggregatibacter sp.]